MAVNNDRPVGTGPALPVARTDTTAPVATTGQVAQTPAAPAPYQPTSEARPHSKGGKAAAKLNDELMRTARRDNPIKTNVNIGLVKVEAGVSYKGLTPANDTDPVRTKSGQDGKVWMQMTFNGKVGAGSGLVSGSSEIQSKVILPTDVNVADATLGKVFQAFRHGTNEAARGLAVPFDADEPFLTKEVSKLPPGAEYSTKFTREMKVGPHQSVSVGAGSVGASASAGLVNATTREFARSVYRMPTTDVRPPGSLGVVYAEVGETANNKFEASASFKAGSELDGVFGNAVERQLDRRYGVDGSLSAALSTNKPFTIGGKFDLDVPAQKEAYEKLMAADPFELKAKRETVMASLAAAGVGFEFETTQKLDSKGASLRAGRNNLISFSSVSRAEKGQLSVANSDGSGLQTHAMSEAEYSKGLTGKIPMALLGRNGDVDVRGTQIVEKDPQGNVVSTSLGASMAMNIDMDKVKQGSVDRTRNLFKDMGVDLGTVDTSKVVGKKGHLGVEFAMTDKFFTALQGLGNTAEKESELKAKLDENYRDIHGSLPPWKNDTVFEDGYPSLKKTTLEYEFAEATKLLANNPADSGRNPHNEYRIATGGRNLNDDMKMKATFDRVSHELAKANGDPSTWKPIVDAVGKASPAGFLVLATTAHELEAPMVQFSIKGEGVDVSAQPNLAARTKSIKEHVGALTSRWN